MVRRSHATVQKLGEASAFLKSVRGSVSKVSRVASLIRGMGVNEASVQLSFCRRRSARDMRKLLLSAIANAENNHDLDVDALYVKEVRVGKAFVARRVRARARGRGARILKPYSRLELIVAEESER